MTEIVVKSKVLSVLDELNIKYVIKNNIAFLVEHDSLSIQLTGIDNSMYNSIHI